MGAASATIRWRVISPLFTASFPDRTILLKKDASVSFLLNLMLCETNRSQIPDQGLSRGDCCQYSGTSCTRKSGLTTASGQSLGDSADGDTRNLHGVAGHFNRQRFT